MRIEGYNRILLGYNGILSHFSGIGVWRLVSELFDWDG